MDNPATARQYPWGDSTDPNRANYADTQIGPPSAVGAFVGGASPYGVEELSGNLWEWTRSLGEFEYPYANKLKECENLKAKDDVSRVVRGGAFNYYPVLVRCAFRYRGYPNLGNFYQGFRVVVSHSS